MGRQSTCAIQLQGIRAMHIYIIHLYMIYTHTLELCDPVLVHGGLPMHVVWVCWRTCMCLKH